jgi:hypothetical protein
MTGGGSGPAPGSAPVAQTGAADPLVTTIPPERVAERWAMEEPAGSTALDALLVDHRERASASGLTGFIPYAAVVGPDGLR